MGHVLVTVCLPLYESWNLLSVPAVSPKLRLPLAPGKGSELLVEGREGGKNTGHTCLLSTYSVLHPREFISPAQQLGRDLSRKHTQVRVSDCLVTTSGVGLDIYLPGISHISHMTP